MSYELTPQERVQAITENVATLTIPELVAIIPEVHYQFFMKLAQDGLDVYAYKIELAPSNATIAYNVWCMDVRVPYSNTPRRWNVESITWVNGDLVQQGNSTSSEALNAANIAALGITREHTDYLYVLSFQDVRTSEYRTIYKYIYPSQSDDMNSYEDRVKRHILALGQHLNVFGGEPTSDITD